MGKLRPRWTATQPQWDMLAQAPEPGSLDPSSFISITNRACGSLPLSWQGLRTHGIPCPHCIGEETDLRSISRPGSHRTLLTGPELKTRVIDIPELSSLERVNPLMSVLNRHFPRIQQKNHVGRVQFHKVYLKGEGSTCCSSPISYTLAHAGQDL